MSSALENLPAELLDIILESLSDFISDDEYDAHLKLYCRLSRISKTLWHAATPYLYREVRFRQRHPRTSKFARTLCERPDLAYHVHELDAKPSRSKRESSPVPHETALFQRQLKPLTGHFTYALLIAALKTGCYTAELIVSLTLCTQLRKLTLATHDYNHGKGSDPQSSLCRRCPDVLSCLLAIHGSGFPKWSLDKLTHANLFGRQSLQYPWICAPGTSNVRTLVLRSDNFKAPEVLELIGSCKALRNLEVIWGAGDLSAAQPLEVSSGFNIGSQALLAALNRHSETLERLVLVSLHSGGAISECHSALGSLRHFQNLHKLKIDESLLIGAYPTWHAGSLRDQLPQRLEKLVIHSAGDLERLGDIVAACSQYEAFDLGDLRITFDITAELEDEYPDLFDEAVFVVDDKTWSLGKDFYDGVTRAVFQCWEQPMPPMLAALADSIAENGVQHLLDIQTCRDGVSEDEEESDSDDRMDEDDEDEEGSDSDDRMDEGEEDEEMGMLAGGEDLEDEGID
ncbi:hypothetical protein LTR85_001138 [Meristemomyces frigidus]|nr:hypothetical protein LTR85_001138 [Meristemomyces frigidus]